MKLCDFSGAMMIEEAIEDEDEIEDAVDHLPTHVIPPEVIFFIIYSFH